MKAKADYAAYEEFLNLYELNLKWQKNMDYKHNPKLTKKARELRKNMTNEENHLWYDFLKTYPVRFLKQKVIDNYIVDFYCAGAKLAVELDGSRHYEPEGEKYDMQRTRILEKRGILVLRFQNNDVNGDFKQVCDTIDKTVKERLETDKR